MATFWHSRPAIWGRRLIFAVLIFAGIGYGVLKMAERSKEPIRQGLEIPLKEFTGQDAQITDLIAVRLVPDVIFKMSGVVVRDKEAVDKTLMSADQVYIGMPLKNVILGVQDYLGIEVKGLEVASGYFLSKKLKIDYAGISDPKASKTVPMFLAEGMYNNLPVLLTAEMDRWDRNGKAPVYSFKDEFPVTFKLGSLEGSTTFVSKGPRTGLQNVHLNYKGGSAKFYVTGIYKKLAEMKVFGMIEGVPFNAELTEGDDSKMLRIIPDTDDPKAIEKITKFVTGIQKDMGLDEKTLKFSIEVTPKETAKK